MSVRNKPERKRARRAYRENFKNPLPGRIDLIAWIKLRSNVTTGDAVRLILSGCLRVDSHKVGFTTVKIGQDHERKILNRYGPAEWRGRIEVVSPDAA